MRSPPPRRYHSRDHSRERRYERSPSPRLRVPPSVVPAPSRTTSVSVPVSAPAPAPPAPSVPPPPIIPPPPPPPPPPSFPAVSQQPQLTPEQLKVLWADRIRFLADSITSRQLFNKVEADIASTRKLIDSTRFPSLEDEGKQRLEAELNDLERKREQLRKKRDDASAQLMKLNSWPSTPLSDAQEAERGKHQELLELVQHLQQSATELDALLRKLKDSNHPIPSDGDANNDSHSNPSSRPLKRRRLLDLESQPPEPIVGPTMEDLEAMHDKITELEGRYSTLQNDMYSHDEEAKEVLESRLDHQLDMFTQSLSVEPVVAGQEAYDELKGGLDMTGNEVEVLDKELSELMLQTAAQQKGMEDIKNKIQGSNAEFAQMQKKFETYATAREKDHKTIAALEAALQVYISTPPPTNPAPQLTYDQLVELMEEPLLDIVRAKIQPLVEQLRAEVQEMLRSQNQETYKTIWGELSSTMRMIEAISQRVGNSQDQIQSKT